MDLPSVLSAYKRLAKSYNFYFGRVFHPGRKMAVELADMNGDLKILEVGAGTGLSLPLYSPQIEVTGIDISPEMLERAKLLVKELNLKHVKALEVMNAENMTFPDNSFDCVVAMYVATVVPNLQRFADEMKRVCKPGGRIIILNHFNQPDTIVGKVAGSMGPLSAYLGFRSDLTLEEFLAKTHFVVKNKLSVNVMGLWTILVCENT